MDIVFNLLLIGHFVAFAVGITTTIGMPIVMGVMPRLAPEGRAVLASLVPVFSRNARLAFGALVLTGLAMMAVRYGGAGGMTGWFWLKMGLVAVVFLALLAGLLLKPGQISPRVMGWITRLSMLGIVVSAVFAFN
jgi:hypothetical protein